MKHHSRGTVDDHVERLCTQGCRVVRERIEKMEQGAWGMDLAGLDLAEKRAVLEELQSIMAVYGPACRTETVEPGYAYPVKNAIGLL